MHSNKKLVTIFLAITLCASGVSTAFAEYEPNDNYSKLILSFQSTSFATPVCINNECHEGVGGLAVTYARQVIDNLALGVSGSYLTSMGSTSAVKSANGAVFVQGIAGLGKRVDIGGSVAALRTSFQLCTLNPESCNVTNDNGTDVGVFGKYFLNDIRSMTLGLNYNNIYFKETASQSVVTLSFITIFAKHHRLTVSVDRVRDLNGTPVSGGYGLGYSYLVF